MLPRSTLRLVFGDFLFLGAEGFCDFFFCFCIYASCEFSLMWAGGFLSSLFCVSMVYHSRDCHDSYEFFQKKLSEVLNFILCSLPLQFSGSSAKAFPTSIRSARGSEGILPWDVPTSCYRVFSCPYTIRKRRNEKWFFRFIKSQVKVVQFGNLRVLMCINRCARQKSFELWLSLRSS